MTSYLQPQSLLEATLQRLRREPQPWTLSTLKNHKLALQKDIPKNIKPNALTRLNPPETRRPAVIDGSVVDVRPGHSGLVVANLEGYVRQRGAAGVRIPALSLVVFRASNAFVVRSHDGVVDEEERGARVCDRVEGVRVRVGVADRVAGRGEGPEALAAVDGDVLDVPRVRGVVDGAEAVGAWGALLEIDGEERGC